VPKKLIGLDIGTHSIKVAELNSTLQGYRLKRYFQRKVGGAGNGTPNKKQVVEVLRQLFSGKKIRGDTIVASFPGNRVSYRVVEFPFNDQQKIEMTVPYEIENDIPFSLNDMVVDHIILSENEGKTQVLTATVQKGDLREFLDLLAEADLDPEIVDLDIFGLFHFYQNMARKPYPTAMVDIGHSKTLVCIVDKERIRMVKAIPFAGCNFFTNPPPEAGSQPDENLHIETVSSEGESSFNPSVLDLLIEELNRLFYTFEYQQDGTTVPTVLVSGGCVENDEMIHRFADGLGRRVEVISLNMMPPEFASRKFADHFQVMAVSVGMAFRGAGDRATHANFRKGEFSYKKTGEALRSRALVSAVLGGLALFFLLLNFASTVWEKERQYSKLQDQIKTIFKRTHPGVTRIVNPSQQMKNSLADLKKKAELLGQAGQTHQTFLNGIKLISTEIPETVKVTIFEMLYISDEFRLLGETSSFESVERIKTKFEGLPEVTSVDVDFASTNIKQSGVKFRMDIRF